MPQWDFLDFLADKARAYPGFHLVMNAEVTDLQEDGGRIVGVRVRTSEEERAIRSRLVIGADGRHSVVRERAGLEVIGQAPPMDVLWFQLSRRQEEALPFFRPGRGTALIIIDRGTYWQIANVIPTGRYQASKQAGIEDLGSTVADLVPELADRVSELVTWEDVGFLQVSVDRLRQWYRPGLICIGDAAHAMSPAGGVGINLAIQDAVATANILGPILRRGDLPANEDLARVQRRRQLPTRLIQAIQLRAVGGLYPRTVDDDRSRRLPFAFRLFRAIPPLSHLTGRAIGLGFRPEHVAQPETR
jgi:2-polyprenyl-6-methoxyphenol hydroxylase-like FAD-dependent oxidoreductase